MTKTTIQQALSTYERHVQTLRSSVASAEVELEAWTAIANDLASQHVTAKDIATTIMLYPDEKWMSAIRRSNDAGVVELHEALKTTLQVEKNQHTLWQNTQKDIQYKISSWSQEKTEIFNKIRTAREQLMTANIGLRGWQERVTREDEWLAPHMTQWKNQDAKSGSPFQKDYDARLGFFEQPWMLRWFNSAKYQNLMLARTYRDTFGHALAEGIERYRTRENNIQLHQATIETASRTLDSLNAADDLLTKRQMEASQQLRDTTVLLDNAIRQQPVFIHETQRATIAAVVGYCLIHRIARLGALTIPLPENQDAAVLHGKWQAAQTVQHQLKDLVAHWNDAALHAATGSAKLTALKRKHGGHAKVDVNLTPLEKIAAQSQATAKALAKEQPAVRSHFVQTSQPPVSSSTSSASNDSTFWQMMWMHSLFANTSATASDAWHKEALPDTPPSLFDTPMLEPETSWSNVEVLPSSDTGYSSSNSHSSDYSSSTSTYDSSSYDSGSYDSGSSSCGSCD